MTEPDEALLYAREHWATICDEDGFSDEAEAYRRGLCDKTLVTDALFYRAGAAASEARIKALEGFLRHLREWDQMNPPMTGDHAAKAASIDALLKEADQ